MPGGVGLVVGFFFGCIADPPGRSIMYQSGKGGGGEIIIGHLRLPDLMAG